MPVSTSDATDSWTQRRQAANRLAVAGKLNEARQCLSLLISSAVSSHDRAAAFNDRAALAAVRGFHHAAQRDWERAARLNPELSTCRRNLAILQERFSELGLAESGASRGRIAILSLLFNWPSTGGGTVHTKELAEALQQDGYAVQHIYAVHEPWRLGQVTEDLSVPTTPLHFNESDWHGAEIRRRFREAVDEFAPDAVIITDSWSTKPLLAEAVADYPYFLRLAAQETICPLNNVRLLWDGHTLSQCDQNQLADPDTCQACLARQAHSSGGLHQAERQLAGIDDDDYAARLWQAYRGAEAVLVVNPAIAELVRPYCRRVEIIPSGFDPQRFPPPLHQSPSDRPVRFLFAGLVDELMKGFSVLWEACQQLWQTRQDFELWVTSEARPNRNAPFIRWVGWQSQGDLPTVMRDCDVLVFPTLAQEALGRTAVEAMGCGKPVIASRIGGLAWVVEDGRTGWLVNTGEISDLAEKMAGAIDQPQRRQEFGAAGRHKFERDFPWPVILARHYRPLFKQLVAQP